MAGNVPIIPSLMMNMTISLAVVFRHPCQASVSNADTAQPQDVSVKLVGNETQYIAHYSYICIIIAGHDITIMNKI